MLNNRYLYLESWTEGRLAELRRVAATEAQLRALRQSRGELTWVRRIMAQLGRALVSWGTQLQGHGRLQPRAEH
ncbi:MAG: hypothetical protein GXY76_03340 [Chloroflexi bacterium]|nr:hypothetical protein [Chloroflexota bacterium]